MSDEQTSFKVTDRRLFNADGSPRELSPEEQQAAEKAQAEIPPVPKVEPKPPNETAAAPTAEASEPELAGEGADAEDPASFLNFLMSIASNAASTLGMMEHPVTHKREVDLELGKHWIDVLGMLKDKTRGNLNSQEAQLLESLLSDLRMQYVSLANTASPKASQAFSGRDITGGR